MKDINDNEKIIADFIDSIFGFKLIRVFILLLLFIGVFVVGVLLNFFIGG